MHLFIHHYSQIAPKASPSVDRLQWIVIFHLPSLSYPSAKVFVHEAKQKDFLSAVDEIMKRLKSNNENIEINYRKVVFERQRSQETLSEGEIKIPDQIGFRKVFNSLRPLVCGLGERSFSLLIDSTLGGCSEVRALLADNHVPYFNFDYTIQSFVRPMEAYLDARKAADAIFIFPDAAQSEEAIFSFITRSTLRVMLLDELTPRVLERLKTLRPVPNFYAIIADSVNMAKLFGNVSRNP